MRRIIAIFKLGRRPKRKPMPRCRAYPFEGYRDLNNSRSRAFADWYFGLPIMLCTGEPCRTQP